MNPTKLELQHICGYLPYGLKIKHCNEIDIVTNYYIVSNDIWLDTVKTGSSLISVCLPILNRIEDMSKEQLQELQNIYDNSQKMLPKIIIECSKFFYSNHIDIHNLIDAGLALDAKTI